MSWSKRLKTPITGSFEHWKICLTSVSNQKDSVLYKWLQNHGLIASSMRCDLCTCLCKKVFKKQDREGRMCGGAVDPSRENLLGSLKFILQRKSLWCTRDLGVYPGVVVEVIFALMCCSIGNGLQKKLQSIGRTSCGTCVANLLMDYTTTATKYSRENLKLMKVCSAHDASITKETTVDIRCGY